jgi:uncharacterized paraquat-inducible protein A
MTDTLATTDELEFDGDAVYAADEVACPRCGQTVRVVMRATLSLTAAADDDDETQGEDSQP